MKYEECAHTLKFLGEEFEINGDEFDLNFERENPKPKICLINIIIKIKILIDIIKILIKS